MLMQKLGSKIGPSAYKASTFTPNNTDLSATILGAAVLEYATHIFIPIFRGIPLIYT